MDLIQPDIQCLVCTRPFSLESPPIDTLESLAICPECKQIVLTNQEIQTRPITPNLTQYRRTRRRSRPRAQLTRTEFTDDSDPDSFAHQFSQIINSARQSTSSNRWRALSSDNESEMDVSIFGESEMDASSFGPYGPDSDAYMSDREFFAQFDNINYNNNGNYDVDPMHTGLSPSQWDTEEESEWEEISELDENINPFSSPHLQIPNPNPNPNPNSSLSPQWMRSRWRMGPLQIDITQPFAGHPGDYIDSNQFEELLEQLAEESDDVRRAGPLATSEAFRERIPKLVVTREMMRESGELICAVCKDPMGVGIRVLKLPCQHMYHDCCINPWLRCRNTCPVCRYELPVEKGEMERYEYDTNVEDTETEEEEEEEEYEEEVVVLRMEGQDRAIERSEGGGRGGWLLLAPIVSFVGIVLVLCFKNVSSGNRTGGDRNRNGEDVGFGGGNNGDSSRGLEERKRWWSIF